MPPRYVKPLPRFVVELDVHAAVRELKLELQDRTVDDPGDHRRRQVSEGHDRIETVAEFPA